MRINIFFKQFLNFFNQNTHIPRLIFDFDAQGEIFHKISNVLDDNLKRSSK